MYAGYGIPTSARQRHMCAEYRIHTSTRHETFERNKMYTPVRGKNTCARNTVYAPVRGKGPAEIQVEGQVLHVYVQLVVAQTHSSLNYIDR
jgi:hypothetical protein